MASQVEGEFITPAEFEDDSRWIRAVKAHSAAAAHQPITSTPPASTLSNTPALSPNTTPTTTTLRRELPAFPPPPPIYIPWPEASTTPTIATNTTAKPPVSSITQPHTSDSKIAALEAAIAAQQLQIQELSLQLQAALARLFSPAPPPPSPAPAPTRMPSPPVPAEESMNTAPSAASSRASSPTRRPPHKRRSPSSDAIAPHERDVVRETVSFLEAFEQRFTARFARLEERVVAIDTRVALEALEALVAALEARQSASEATLAHLSLPAPLTPAPTPTPPGVPAIHHGQIVDWDRFRSIRLTNSSSSAITDLSAWTETLLADVRTATSTIPAAPHSSMADSRLLHLWEAYHVVHRRWTHNRRLRLRLARLASEMEEHCSSLLRQQWGQTCDRMAGNLGLRDTWSLLRVLLDPTHTKASQRKDISHLLHSSPLTDTEFLAALRDRYLCTDPPIPLPAYTGSPNPDLDADISLGEVRAALFTLRTTSAPGADRITNKALRNLDTPSLEALTDLLNTHWQAGTLPSSWTHARVSFIPKPGKPISLEHLRPISLTSCLGKLFEHVILARLQTYLDDRDLYPDSMFGFRPQLSTQDVMLQLSEDVLHPSHHKLTRAILALDLTKAFDNVHHTAILDALSSLDVGPRVHAYITAFLAHRTAEISYGPLSSPSFSLGNKGTPQGSVLSPILFNITLFPFARALSTIPALSHAFYADDITLWVTTGNIGDIEATLQASVDAVTTHARAIGLSCSPTKSGLLVLLPRGMAALSPFPLTVSVDGTPLPLVSTLRILGLFLQSNGKHTTLITQLSNTVHQTMRLIRRIANRHCGMREHDRRRLVQAFVLSRFVYSLPYLFLSRTEEDKVNSLIRQAYKSALSLPTSTSTARLLSMGVHNSLTELTEAHRTAQLLRPSRTRPPLLCLFPPLCPSLPTSPPS
ncbi:uncharacterized protein LOC125759460 [Rhipicephalus sanguineus]|uniref:uncharacterized protein LOC125759460 n=1 Tax=Rhipicephalus sanguineus TaxID=34632 RepID=UPI0020C1EBB9|nr:uncharacterized protein LOC125759460 [Rhipicephalus sanguineus]